jgi:hypothetical protein
MLVIEIPYWVVFAIVIIAALFGLCSMIAVAFDIHMGNWRDKLLSVKRNYLLLYGRVVYRYKTVGSYKEGTDKDIVSKDYLEKCAWINENVKSGDAWYESFVLELVSPRVLQLCKDHTYTFRFKRAEDLTHYLIRWAK